jgi:hypothetical protein
LLRKSGAQDLLKRTVSSLLQTGSVKESLPKLAEKGADLAKEAIVSRIEGREPVVNVSDEIRCSCVDSNSSFLNNQPSDIVISFVPRSGPSTLLDVRPLHLIYLPITTKILSSITMSVTNQVNRIIDLNGEHTSYVLHIREKVK